MSYFFAFLLFLAPLCLVVGAKKYFFGALYKNSDGSYSGLICNCSPRASFEEVDDEEDDGSNCK